MFNDKSDFEHIKLSETLTHEIRELEHKHSMLYLSDPMDWTENKRLRREIDSRYEILRKIDGDIYLPDDLYTKDNSLWSKILLWVKLMLD